MDNYVEYVDKYIKSADKTGIALLNLASYPQYRRQLWIKYVNVQNESILCKMKLSDHRDGKIVDGRESDGALRQRRNWKSYRHIASIKLPSAEQTPCLLTASEVCDPIRQFRYDFAYFCLIMITLSF